MNDGRFKKGEGLGNTDGFKKGQIPWNKGRTWSPEIRAKISQSKKANPVRYWLGKKRPELTGENNPLKGKFGKDHPRWTDNKKRPFYKAIREIFKYVEWRKAIFKRDKYLCVLCGKGGELNADHYPKRFTDILKENKVKTVNEAIDCKELWDINNGRTLCLACHLKTPTWGRRLG